MVRCRICNRVLKNPLAIEKGIGPVCARRVGAIKAAMDKHDAGGDEIVPYDGGDFFIERLASETITGPNMQTEMLKHPASGIRSNVPRRITKHSPDGYNFGYGGSGPADFALNVCMALVHADDAYQHYQDFKWHFVAVGDSEAERLDIKRADAEKWFTDRGVKILK